MSAKLVESSIKRLDSGYLLTYKWSNGLIRQEAVSNWSELVDRLRQMVRQTEEQGWSARDANGD